MSSAPVMAAESGQQNPLAEGPPTGELAASQIDAPVAEVKPERIEEVPAHRSHDPSSNAKRTDPFMFGQRYLEAGDNVYEYNAWDHVETDDAYKEYAEKQFEMQRQSPVSDFDKSKTPFLTRHPFLDDDSPTKCIVHLKT